VIHKGKQRMGGGTCKHSLPSASLHQVVQPASSSDSTQRPCLLHPLNASELTLVDGSHLTVVYPGEPVSVSTVAHPGSLPAL
jgi:hypothetical protein